MLRCADRQAPAIAAMAANHTQEMTSVDFRTTGLSQYCSGTVSLAYWRVNGRPARIDASTISARAEFDST